MEVEGEEKSRKRMKRTFQEKLGVGEKVEVLFMDEGFSGSWNAGVVHDSGINCRYVEFTHLLSDAKQSQFKQWITVSAAIAGGSRSNPKNYRGNIRPMRPQTNVQASDIKYGTCVDALVEDAWWEGVVIDNDNNAYEKLIFFPDEGDQQKITVDQLRLTQDWDEVSGCWKSRGEWMLLQVLEPFKKEDVMPVSVRQIWYDLRATDAFLDKIGSWPCGQQHIWQELVSGLIQVLLAVADALPLNGLDAYTSTADPLTSDDIGGNVLTDLQTDGTECLSQRIHVDSNCSLTPAGKEFGESGRFFCALSEFISEFHNRDMSLGPAWKRRFIDKRHCAEVHLSAAGWKFEDNLYVSPEGKTYVSLIEACEARIGIEQNGEVHDTVKYTKDKIVLCNNQPAVPSRRLKDQYNKAEDCSATIIAESWEPVILQPEYCADLASICSSYLETGGRKRANQNSDKLKKYLVQEGWRIEFKHDTMPRFRYLSPDGITYYYSLIKVCSYLIDQKYRNDSLEGCYSYSEQPQLGTRNKNHSGVSSGDVGLHADKEETLKHVHENDFRDVSEMKYCEGLLEPNFMLASTSAVINERACSNGSCSTSRKQSKHSNVGTLKGGSKQVNLLESVRKYVEFIEKGQWNKDTVLVGNVKKHLKLLGWSLWWRDKKTRKEVKYTSPNGKNYISLYRACKGLLEEQQESSTEKSTQSMNTVGESELQSVTGKSTNSINTGTYFRHCRLFSAANSHNFQGAAHIHDEGSMSIANLGNKLLQQPLGKFSIKQKKRKMKSKRHTKQSRGSSSRFSPRLLQLSNRSQLVLQPSSSQHVRKTILSWLIDKDVILPREKVTYIRKADGCVMKHGRVTRDGIKCSCCDKVFSLANFQSHAGCSTPQPAASIFLSDGRSLLQHQMQVVLTNKPKYVPHERLKGNYSQYEGDSECSICHNGGNLVLCDHCPSAFHPDCIGLEDVPEGNWCCPPCQCGLCGLGEFNCDTDQFTDRSMLCCDQCELGYHVGCLREKGSSQLSSSPTGSWVCSKNCAKIYNCLQELLGESNSTREGLSWTILRSSRENGTGKFDDDETIAEYHSKLYIALDVLHECFEPVIESRTKSDVVSDLLFNKVSELRRLNFRGMYTIILEREDELISVATFRVYGDKVAEMPFIGTRVQFRRKGMCRFLVNKLEKLLSPLGVERLVLPAIPQLLQTWTGCFGFTQMTKYERMELLRYNILGFQGTSMCQKFLKPRSKISVALRGPGRRSIQKMDIDNDSTVSEVKKTRGTVEENAYQVDAALSLIDGSFKGHAVRMEHEKMNDRTSERLPRKQLFSRGNPFGCNGKKQARALGCGSLC